eukprot:Tbor_TRINITY_DN2786_c0_g1::TRINITY_DN2786_c0_g1_i1::g.15254::m.15254
MGALSFAVTAASMLWNAGGQLRQAYNASTDEAQRRNDRFSTATRASIFVGWLMFAIISESLVHRNLLEADHNNDIYSSTSTTDNSDLHLPVLQEGNIDSQHVAVSSSISPMSTSFTVDHVPAAV